MVISLLGIIFIQYKWIENTIAEKQKLIDNQVLDGVAKVEEQLNDLKGIKLFKERLNRPLEKMRTRTQNVTVLTESDSNAFIEIKIFGDSLKHHFHHEAEVQNVEHDGYVFQHNQIISTDEGDSMVFIVEQGNVDHIINVMDKFNFEGVHRRGDIRLDSVKLQALLHTELQPLIKKSRLDWGLYDADSDDYLFRPADHRKMDYSVPLFSTDIVYPRRYELQLSLNTNDIIWNDIRVMTLLSLLFLLVIISVFGFSIKLIIKHKKISQIKSDFINNMTHEFKTPLASISLAADSLIHPNAVLTESYLKQYVDIIQQEKRKLNSHVERILEVAALNRDALEIAIETISVNEVTEKAISNLNLLIEKNQAEVIFESADEIKAMANATHLENVMVNLIENAIKYGGDRPRITVFVGAESSQVLITVKDHGIGMSNKQVNRAFDHFYRAQTGDLHNSKGFGLGLSYCKLVIEKMEGTIKVHSKVNEGTTVIITLNAGI